MPKPRPSASNHDEDDIAAIKQSLAKLQNDMSEVLNQNKEISESLSVSLKEIENIKKENIFLREQSELKDKRIKELDSRLDLIEQYTRSENIVVSGLKVQTAGSFSDSVKINTDKEQEVIPDSISVEKQVVTFFNQKDIPLKSEDISVCHPIGKKEIKDIVVRMVNRKSVEMVLKKVKKEKCLEGLDVFVSEHLTQKNSELAAIGRKLRFLKKISNTWVRNGRVFIRTLGRTAEDERTVHIRDKDTFEELKLEIKDILKK